jgi:hypothetical protein
MILQKDLPEITEEDVSFAFKAGLISSITPLNTLRLVHAIQKPLYAASFTSQLNVSARRTFGKAVVVTDTIKVHRASTAKIDVLASWIDYSDSRNLPWPQEAPGQLNFPISVNIKLPDLTIAPDLSHETVKVKIRHNFPDSRFRKVSYQIKSTTRYRDYFDKQTTDDQSKIGSTNRFQWRTIFYCENLILRCLTFGMIPKRT